MLWSACAAFGWIEALRSPQGERSSRCNGNCVTVLPHRLLVLVIRFELNVLRPFVSGTVTSRQMLHKLEHLDWLIFAMKTS